MKKVKGGKRRRLPAVDYKRFVKLWRGAKSVGDVAGALGIRNNSCSAIASRLRAGGVKLKRFPRRAAQPIDEKALNRITAR